MAFLLSVKDDCRWNWLQNPSHTDRKSTGEKQMSFDYRVQAGLYRQLDKSEKRFEQIDLATEDTEEAMSALFEEKLNVLSSLHASSTYTHFLSERAKVVIDGIQ
jgi:hypothetical protein